MKHIFLVAIAIVLSQFTKAQDTIIKHNGEQIRGKVTEITTTEIKYKKFDFQDGPLYVINKSDIQLIKYSNGLKEEFQVQQIKENPKPVQNTPDYYGGPAVPQNKIELWGNRYQYKNAIINERELHSMLLQSKNKHIISLVGSSKDAHALQFIGFGAFPLGIAALYFLGESMSSTYAYSNGPDSGDLAASGICLIAAIACPIASGIFKSNRTKYNRQAVKLYNESY